MNDKTLIPFGPQHPVFPEPIQLRLVLEDEKVIEALPVLGYVHRGLERLAQERDFQQNVYLMERVCGICSFIHALTYCQGIEALMELTPPPRARFLRVIWSELHRLHSHLLWLGLLADAFGFENLFMQVWRTRETILELQEATGGGRIIVSTCCIGGVRRDIPSDLQDMTLERLNGLEREIAEYTQVMLEDVTVKERLVNVGTITPEEAWQLGAVGPVARACGIKMDHRTTGYAAYGEIGVVPQTWTGGDCYARSMVRMLEMKQSIDLIRAAFKKMKEGPLTVPVKGFPDGEFISRCEQPRGEVLYFLKANNTRNLARLRIRTPTFANLAPLLKMLPGMQISDVAVIVLSIDPCISCTER